MSLFVSFFRATLPTTKVCLAMFTLFSVLALNESIFEIDIWIRKETS